MVAGPSKPGLVLIKLGGSLITDKAAPDSARPEMLRRLAQEIADASAGMPERIVLGHGAGSFGHVAAARHGLGHGPIDPGRLHGVSATQERTARLHLMVVESLLTAGAAPFSLAPSSFVCASAGRPVKKRWEWGRWRNGSSRISAPDCRNTPIK